METDARLRDIASQADDAGRSPARLPYPLARGDVVFWLQRGERLGRALCWIAATVAAGSKRAAKWRRQERGKGPGHLPPAPV